MSQTILRVKSDFKSKLLAKTSAFTFEVRAGFYIKDIIINNTTANAVTGGLKFGTTLGGTEVISAVAVGSSAFLVVADASYTKRVFSTTANTTVYVDAVTGWNSASLDITLVLGKM